MRDIGFWVRIVAIGQLFSLVLANFGQGWLASDNPVLNLRERPAPPKPLSEIVAEARPEGAAAVSASTSLEESRRRDIAGWGSADEPEVGWSGEDSSDGAGNDSWFEGDDAKESHWGKGLDR